MKLIDLLNKIANGEEVPKKIKYDTMNYYFRNYDYKEVHGELIDEQTSFIEKIDFYKLNDEVEIIEEEKEIKEIAIDNKQNIHNENDCIIATSKEGYLLATKINELIDAVNEMRKEK